MNYEALLNDADAEGLNIKERPFRTYDGRIKGKDIYLRKNMDSTEKACVLAEELGHHYTSVGDILDMTDIGNRKQERQARLWGYNKLIGLSGLIKAYEAGCQDKYEVAEFLGVTDEYLQASQAPEQKKDFTYLENLLQEDFKSIYQKLSPENRQAFWRSTIHEIHLKEDYTVDCVDFL